MIIDEVNHIDLPDFGLVIALPLTIHTMSTQIPTRLTQFISSYIQTK
jgi:hypothetical protein